MQSTPQPSPYLTESLSYPSPKVTLPPEIQLQILHQALISLETLAFCPLPLSRQEVLIEREKHPKHVFRWRRHSHTLRLALLGKCQANEPIAAELMTTFTSLSLVSKTTRSIAREIFFGENKWVLHLTGTFNAVTWIQDFWGLSVISLMRDIRLDLQSLRQSMFFALQLFVGAVDSSRLINLEIRYLEHSRALSGARICAETGQPIMWHFHPMLRDHGLERNREGERGLIIPEGEEDEYDDNGTKYEGPWSEPGEWRVSEVVLMPLGRLRGVKKVRVDGTVTEKFAVWLEGAMVANVGESVVEFDLSNGAKEELAMLEAGSVDDF